MHTLSNRINDALNKLNLTELFTQPSSTHDISWTESQIELLSKEVILLEHLIKELQNHGLISDGLNMRKNAYKELRRSHQEVLNVKRNTQLLDEHDGRVTDAPDYTCQLL